MIKIANKWVFPAPVEVPSALKNSFPASDFLLEALVRRGITTPQEAVSFLDFREYTPASPLSLPGVAEAVERIRSAINAKEIIGVWGDFDVDGQTATAVLVQTLRHLSADVVYHVPIRSQESHSVNVTVLQKFLTPGMHLVITCDTGITAHDAANFLKSTGVDLIITDHHSLPDAIPPALAVINPHLLPDDHPLASLAGVGVAYKLAEALLQDAKTPEAAAGLHDLVALGSIADLAMLSGDTRYLVQSGLDRMRYSPRLFLNRMAEMLDLPLDRLNEEHVSFYLAPRMNAIGRLDDANPMVELLLSSDETQVKSTLDRMEALNANRRVLVNQVLEGCLAQMEANPTLSDQPILILSHNEWPAGVIGIAAGRLAELTYRPVILLTSRSDTILRGSARSVTGIDIMAALTANNALLLNYGGHPMAAGLSLELEKLAEFRAQMSLAVKAMAAERQVEPELVIETQLELDQVNFTLLADLDRLAPFGQGNPAPVFSASNLTLENTAAIGRNSEHVQVTVVDQKDQSYKVLWWQAAGLPVPENKFDLAYTAHLNIYRGAAGIQFEWVDFRPAVEPATSKFIGGRKQFDLIDQRNQNNVDSEQLENLARKGVSIWAEGSGSRQPLTMDRLQLAKNHKLAILTAPPSPEELLEVIARVKPTEITFMGVIPAENNLKDFLRLFGSHLKSLLGQPGSVLELKPEAARFATTPLMIKTALKWFAAKGSVDYRESDQDHFILTPPSSTVYTPLDEVEKRLKVLSEEIIAYRRYYLSAPVQSLINQRGK